MVPLDHEKKIIVHDSSSSSFYQTAFPKLFKSTARILSLNHNIKASREGDKVLQLIREKVSVKMTAADGICPIFPLNLKWIFLEHK